jgi:hypothetical protein
VKHVVGAIVVLALAAPAYAQGVTMVMRYSTAGGPTTSQQIQMDRTHIRAETAANGENMAFVYDGPAKVVRMINLSRKSYTEMDQAQMQKMGQQVNSAMAAMQAQLKNLPPEQQKMMQDLMKGRGLAGPAAAPERPTFMHTGSDKIGQWPCAKYDGYRGAETVAEVCAAEPSALGLTAADFEAAKQLAELVKSMMPAAADQVSFNGTIEDQGFPGIALRRVTLRNGKPESTTELSEIRREAIPASAFAAPAGFRREAMPGAR